MKPESGAPAFDNIDELLTDKIINHGRDHANRPETGAQAAEPDQQTVPVEHIELGKGPSAKTIIVALALTSMIFLILYRLLKRQQNR